MEERDDLETDPRDTRNLRGKAPGQEERERIQMRDHLLGWYNPSTNPYRPRSAGACEESGAGICPLRTRLQYHQFR